jgi:hypothetical protein
MTDSDDRITTIWYDTEFLEDGQTIMPISVGMVRERPGQPGQFDSLYVINGEADLGRIQAHPWLAEHVLPHLPVEQDEAGMYWWNPDHPDYDKVLPLRKMAGLVRLFITTAPSPRLVSWYGAYDHVMLMQLFGPMIKRPAGVPMWTYDLRQKQAELGVDDAQLPHPADGTEHNAIADAWYHQQIDWYLQERSLTGKLDFR